MTPEECAKLVPGDAIIHIGEVLMVTPNDAGEGEVKLARVAFSVGKMRSTNLSTTLEVDRIRG
jgi:hypothetical protein